MTNDMKAKRGGGLSLPSILLGAAITLVALCSCALCGSYILNLGAASEQAPIGAVAPLLATEPLSPTLPPATTAAPPATQTPETGGVQANTPSPIEALRLTRDASEPEQESEQPPAETPEPAATTVLQPTQPPPTAAPAEPRSIPPGTHLVGSDIQRGIYRGEAGLGIFSSCYWARLSDVTGNFDALLANGNAVGQFYVEVRASDFALETTCELTALSLLPEPSGVLTTLEPGIYLVGRDIAPGTYRGQAGLDLVESCYWARLSNVSGDFAGLIANDNAIGQFFVRVLPDDFALETTCPLSRTGS